MTATKINRRAVLRASAATVAMVAPAAALASLPADDGAWLALETRWRATIAEYEKAWGAFDAIAEKLPDHATGGWPLIPADGAGGLFPKSFAGKRIALPELRAFNSRAILDDIAEWGSNEARLARLVAEGDAREAWWTAINDDAAKLRKASGIDKAADHLDTALAAVAAIEDEIFAAPATTFCGVRVKLAVLAKVRRVEMSDSAGNLRTEAMNWSDTELLALSDEAEKIAAGGRS